MMQPTAYDNDSFGRIKKFLRTTIFLWPMMMSAVLDFQALSLKLLDTMVGGTNCTNCYKGATWAQVV